MKIAVFQGPGAVTEIDHIVDSIDSAAKEAAAQGSTLLITPEMSTTGYNIGDSVAARAEFADGPIHRAISGIARRRSIAIVYGYPERGSGDGVYNSVQAIDRAGTTVANYRKTHLFGSVDRRHFRPGDELVVQFSMFGFTCGLLTCYDVEFPETVRAHADAGTQLLIAPTGLMKPFDLVARQVIPARAYESQMYIAYVNRCGTEGEFDYCGLSCVVSPDGTELARADQGEAVLTADLSIDALARSRAVNTHLTDRRPELYTSGQVTAPKEISR